MYATVIFSVSAYPAKWQWFATANPLLPLIETSKSVGLLGAGTFGWQSYLACMAFTLVPSVLGILFFNKTERNFMDVV